MNTLNLDLTNVTNADVHAAAYVTNHAIETMVKMLTDEGFEHKESFDLVMSQIQDKESNMYAYFSKLVAAGYQGLEIAKQRAAK